MSLVEWWWCSLLTFFLNNLYFEKTAWPLARNFITFFSKAPCITSPVTSPCYIYRNRSLDLLRQQKKSRFGPLCQHIIVLRNKIQRTTVVSLGVVFPVLRHLIPNSMLTIFSEVHPFLYLKKSTCFHQPLIQLVRRSIGINPSLLLQAKDKHSGAKTPIGTHTMPQCTSRNKTNY